MTAYLTSVALIITACLAFYKLLLQKETFYRLNRVLLMACLALAFLLPLVPIPQQFSLRVPATKQQPVTQQPATTIGEKALQKPEPLAAQKLTEELAFNKEKALQWAIYLYWIGVAIFALNFLMQLVTLLIRSYRNPAIIDGPYRIVEISGASAPCSFGNTIFINPEKYDWETYSQILLHEKVHIREKHSVDLVLAEIVLVLQWFNPFAWLYRKEIENNLEFLTDDVLVQKEAVEKSSYQLSLLKVSTPQLPLHLTTNYNQSLLKKRILMMNAKKSNLHTTWKYFFLLPLLLVCASLLNEPKLTAQIVTVSNRNMNVVNDTETEGYWFATIKGDKMNIQFRQTEEEGSNYNGSSFKLADFGTLPTGNSGSFQLTREAGTMAFTGKFEGNQGMGKYKFQPNKQYAASMNKEINETLSDRDLMVFFFIDIKMAYVKMLKTEGYKDLDKDKIIPLAALNIDADFIHSLKESGLKGLTLDQMIPLKSLGIDKKYIQEIRTAGYPDISSDQLIAFKSQGIDGSYIKKLNAADSKLGSAKGGQDPDDLISFKALQIDENYVKELRLAGYRANMDQSNLIAMKSLGVDGAYIKSFEAIGYKNIDTDDLIAMKSQNITPEFLKGFEDAGFKNIPLRDFIALKAVGVTPDYIKQMKEKGFNYSDINKYITLKSLD